MERVWVVRGGGEWSERAWIGRERGPCRGEGRRGEVRRKWGETGRMSVPQRAWTCKKNEGTACWERVLPLNWGSRST
jgi:hypothetical protein